MKLWLVEIHEDDWDYDNFVSAAVWADDPEQAEAIVRAEVRTKARSITDTSPAEDVPWIENPAWRLKVSEAPTEGVALVHWHAG